MVVVVGQERVFLLELLEQLLETFALQTQNKIWKVLKKSKYTKKLEFFLVLVFFSIFPRFHYNAGFLFFLHLVLFL